MISKDQLTALILAGGKSSRMGRDKGLISFEEKSFIDHIMLAVRPLVHEIIIVSDNRQYDQFNQKRVEDIHPNNGPVGGIHSGLIHSTTNYNIVLSCDIPRITTQLIQSLLLKESLDTPITFLRVEDKNMPLIGLYHKNCIEQFSNALSQGERRLQTVINACKTKHIDVDPNDFKYTLNINTPEQLNSLYHGNDH